MTCFHPLQAWQKLSDLSKGKAKPVFTRPIDIFLFKEIALPCSQCSGCRLEYSRQWAMRCMHEAELHAANCFITLTYSDKFLPAHGSLHYEHFTKFMKRLRKRFGSGIRYYMAGEYGSQFHRPHYHALIFNFDFDDKVLYSVRNNYRLYISDSLNSLWTDPKSGESMGYASVGSLTFESAAYVARYVMKKVKGDDPFSRYVSDEFDFYTGELYSLVPEQARMSRRPGIAANWFSKFFSDVFPDDFVIVNGRKVRPPRFYDNLLKRMDPQALLDIKASRELSAADFVSQNPDVPLIVREKVLHAKLAMLPRPNSF